MIAYIIEANLILLVLYFSFELIAKRVKWLEVNRLVYFLVPMVSAIVPLLNWETKSNFMGEGIGVFTLDTISVIASNDVLGSSFSYSQLGGVLLSLVLSVGLFQIGREVMKTLQKSYVKHGAYRLNEDGEERMEGWKDKEM